MEYIKLVGILIIVFGFILKLNPSAVVIVSALFTAAVSGMNFNQILALVGQSFVDNRLVTLFFLTLPMVGIMERHGLGVESARLVKKIKSLTPGKIFDAYSFVRELGCLLGIQLHGHVQFIRPLINPMAQAAAKVKNNITNKQSDEIKSLAAADENLSNFFGQNLSIVTGGGLLIASSMKTIGHPINITQTVVYSIPSAIIIIILIVIYNYFFDKKLDKGGR